MLAYLHNYDWTLNKMQDTGEELSEHVAARLVCLPLTHPDLSEAALAQFELQSQGLAGDLPGVFSKPLGLRLDCRAHCGQPVAKPVGVLCEKAR